MDLLTKENLKTLIERRGETQVSIFMPTHRAGREVMQDPIRLKNLLNEAKEKLQATGLGTGQAQKMIAPAQEFLDDNVFWQHQSDGLAIFIAPDFFESYRLPLNFEELVVVANRFHIKPLLSLFSSDSRFYLLALSQNQVKLFQGSRFSIAELDLGDVPGSLAEALQFDEIRKQQQYHTKTAQPTGARAAIYHGQGGGKEDENEQLFRFFRQIDDGLLQVIENREPPLILACVEYLFPIYKNANNYPNLLDDHIDGNPDQARPDELHKRAWETLQPLVDQDRQETVAQFHHLANTDRASQDIRQIVPAAYAGKVDTLFVAVGHQQWGQFDLHTNTIELYPDAEPGSKDLLDSAAVQTLLHSGTVYALDAENMPGGSPLAAIFRY